MVYQTIYDIFSQLLPWLRHQKCFLVFLMPNKMLIQQAHRITVVALHLGVFQGVVYFLMEALWIKNIEESNDKFY